MVESITDALVPDSLPPLLVIVCPVCGRHSRHPDDIADGFCGNCHQRTHGPVINLDDPGTRWIQLPLTLSWCDALADQQAGFTVVQIGADGTATAVVVTVTR